MSPVPRSSTSALVRTLVVPVVVVAESPWLIGNRLGAPVEAAFVASVAAGDFAVADLTDDDWSRVPELTERYTDLDLGLIDASVIPVAERLNVVTVATLNDRDSTSYGPVTSQPWS